MCGNWRSDTLTAPARKVRRRARSLMRPNSLLRSTSNPLSLRRATSAERSAGCSYARELIPTRRTRARSGTVILAWYSRAEPLDSVRRKFAVYLVSRPAEREPTLKKYSRAAEGGPGLSNLNGRRRIGVMGGTFDPIHHGHLVAGSEVAHIFGLDQVTFVPTGQPWQKEGRAVSPAEDRYLMTVIATASNPRFSVSRVDID